jgi:diguanylate cyclase (GGDEF)-like protein
MKPKVFVGSSKEGLPIAHSIQEELEFDAEVTVWKQDIFRPGATTIESLQSALLMFDFAVFVMSPDDRITSRGSAGQAPRDNVIFELGLFIGRLGKDRVFFIVPRNTPKMHIPTDLLGVTALSFDPARSDRNIRASVGPACNQMRRVFAICAQITSQGSAKSTSREENELTSALKATIEEAVSRIHEAPSPSVLFADIDGFSAVNKWFGAEVCDKVIEVIKGLCTEAFRDHFWSRFGGDQFIACIGGKWDSQVMKIGRNFVQAVANREWASIAPGLYVTMSVGLATEQANEPATDWVIRAIHGSILAKKAGGNRVSEAPMKLGRGVSRTWSDYDS